MSSEPPLPRSWEGLLSDKDVIVLTKATFFQNVNLLFRYAEAPGRCTWEFFHYRGYEYILGTWCATFNVEGFAVSCGAQHPFIYRFQRGMHYALPDYVLLSHRRDADGEQDDQIVLIVEIKALGVVSPDTEAGRETAENIFQRMWRQRENQAKLAFRSHPSQEVVHIVMASGPWFAPYKFERSRLMGDEASWLDRPSQPKRRRTRRRNITPGYDVEDEDHHAGDRADIGPGDSDGKEQEKDVTASQNGGKRKRGPDTAPPKPEPDPVVNHIFQLGPSGGRDALNPWFLQMLGRMKQDLKLSLGNFETQASWFDWPAHVEPTGDAHAEGFVLPTTVRPVPDIEDIDVGEIERLDEDPALGGVDVPSTPSNIRQAPNMLQLNALLSHTMHRRTRISRDGDAVPSTSTHSRSSTGPLPYQRQEAESIDSDLAPGTDDDTTPKGQHGRTSNPQRQGLELSPSTAYVQRRHHGRANPSQFHSSPPDSSPPHFTPHKQLFGPFTADEGDSEFLTGFYSQPSKPEPVPRPASAPPAPSSPPSRTHHRPTDVGLPSRGDQPLSRDRAQQDHVGHPTPLPLPSHAAWPNRPSLPVPKFRRWERRYHTMGRSPGNERKTATAEEWRRCPANDDELLLIVMGASQMGIRDHEEAFRNAGMDEDQVRRARRRHDEVRGGSKGSGGGGSIAASFAAPPLHIQPGRAADASSMGTGPTFGGAVASGSRPPPRTSATRTAGGNESDSDSLNDNYPDASPSPTAPGSTSDGQVNRLAEGIGNLDVANAPSNAGSPERSLNLPWNRENLYDFTGPLAHHNRRLFFRALGMNAEQTEGAYKGYVLKFAALGGNRKDRERDVFYDFLVSRGAAIADIDRAMEALADEQRRAMTRSDAHLLPGPSDRGREDPPVQQTRDHGFALPGLNPGPGPSRTNVRGKGKEKQA